MTKSSLSPKPRLLDVGREPGHAGWHGPKNRASHQNNLAPLICRVVRAVRVRGRWAWIPVGGPPLPSGFHPQPPITYVIAYDVTYVITYVIAHVITYVMANVITYVIACYCIRYCMRYCIHHYVRYIRHYLCYHILCCILYRIRYQICYVVWYCIRYYL